MVQGVTYGLWFPPNDAYPAGHWFCAPSNIAYSTTSYEAAEVTLRAYFSWTKPERRPIVKQFAK